MNDDQGSGDQRFTEQELRALPAPPANPGSEPAVKFPLGWYRELLEKIAAIGIRVITYDDLFRGSDDWDYESNYAREWEEWKASRDPSIPYLLIQHDVDFRPEFTHRMVALEALHGVRSNLFVFRQRGTLDSPDARYPLDHGFLTAAERHGFVIGYHQNAAQRSQFLPMSPSGVYLDDVLKLRERYRIEYVVPHGGPALTEGGMTIRNVDVKMPDALKTNLRWVLNGHTVRFDQTWSDGGFLRAREIDRPRIKQFDLGRVLKRLKPGRRYRWLLHPQRWGYHVDTASNSILGEQRWYRRLCKRFDTTHAISHGEHPPEAEVFD